PVPPALGGRPSGCTVGSRPSFRTIRACYPGTPYGQPRATLARTRCSSWPVRRAFTARTQSAGRPTGQSLSSARSAAPPLLSSASAPLNPRQVDNSLHLPHFDSPASGSDPPHVAPSPISQVHLPARGESPENRIFDPARGGKND